MRALPWLLLAVLLVLACVDSWGSLEAREGLVPDEPCGAQSGDFWGLDGGR